MEPPTFPSTSHIPANSERDQSIAVHFSKHIRRSRQTHEAPCKRADFASDHMMDEQPCPTGMSNYADIMTSNFPSSPNATPTGPFAPSNQPIPDPSAPFGIDALGLYATSGRKNTLNIVTAVLSGVGATILVAGCFVPYHRFNWRDSSSSSDSNSDKQTLAAFGGGYFFLYIFFAIVVFALLALVLRRHKTGASQWAPCTACLMTSGAVLAISIGEKRTIFRQQVREYSYSPRLGFWLILAAGLLLLACGILGIVLATKATPKVIGVAYLRQSSDKSPSDFAGDPRAVGNVFAAEGARPQPSYGQNPPSPGNERTGPHIGSSPAGHSSGRPSSSFMPPYGRVD